MKKIRTKPVTEEWANYYVPVEVYTELMADNKILVVPELMFKYINKLGLFEKEIKAGLLRVNSDQ